MPTVKRINAKHVEDWEKRRKGIPSPFVAAPETAKSFTTILDPSKVYITHIDRFPAGFKRSIFLVPIILNLSILLLLAWRAWAILPFYIDLWNLILGHPSPLIIADKSSYSTARLVWIVFRRSLNFMFDFVLLRFIAPWPWSFFAESPCNPCSWRWRIGFRHEEIVVRESRGWGGKELMGGSKTGGDSPFFSTRILPAVERGWIAEKSGYMMMNKDWDLDFYAMVVAHGLVDREEVEKVVFEKSVWAHKEGVGWCVWKNHEADRPAQSEEEQRKKIVALKDKLTAMGKESLFFRWIEIVQYESGRPGVYDQKRQLETMKKIKEEFDKNGVDLDKVIEDIGGLDGTPGMEK